MAQTKKLQMELPKEGRFISSEFPILRDNLIKIDQTISDIEENSEEKAPSQHNHTISDITDLETALKSKMAADKTFTFTDLGHIEGAKNAVNGHILYKSSDNRFSFASILSLLSSHQHKTEDIIGLESAYGHLAHTNEWQAANDFKGKVTLSNTIELSQTASLILKQNGTIVTQLSTKGSALKGPATVDSKEIYTKTEATAALQDIHNKIEKITKITTHTPLEILITESGTLPWPEGTTDDTDIEIWAWGAGGGGSGGGNGRGNYYGCGGGGGGCTYMQVKGSQLKSAKNVQIGCGGKGGKNTMGGNGGQTIIPGLLTAGGGGGGGYSNDGKSSSDGNKGSAGESAPGGDGGSFGKKKDILFFLIGRNKNVDGDQGKFNGGGGGHLNATYHGSSRGGCSIFGGGGGGGSSQYLDVTQKQGGLSGKGGNGGNGSNGEFYRSGGGGGGGGGYFPGKDGITNTDATTSSGGDGGNGAVLLRFFIKNDDKNQMKQKNNIYPHNKHVFFR
ncbi:Bgr_08870 family protein [Bartonella sp. ML70XJBT.G]|uniref:Bgr_08870 family protein n=1 Tax=Bartonella sp. ML70XJBT.G TaxID=3019093 RepID=UPI002361A060|nr:Bgr_08870 family protein [Bartonella sp. ML70XJBT.G]